MAKDKKSILIYVDQIHTVEKLTDEQAGRLYKHLLRYVNDLNPTSPDQITEIVFEPIKQQLKRDLKRYEAICQRNKDNGQLGGRPKQTDKNPSKPSGFINNPNKPDKDIDIDIDKDKVSKPNKSADFIDMVINEFVLAHGNYEIVNTGKERAAAGRLLGIYRKKFPDATSEETLNSLRLYFNACVNIGDSWLHDNMSLPIIVSKFNEINNYLRNGKHKQAGATDAELIELFATKYGIKP